MEIKNTFLCFDIGGTSIKYGVFQEDTLILKEETPTNAKSVGGLGILKKLKELTERFNKEYVLSAVGISTAGVVNHENGTIQYANENIPNYIGVDFKKFFKDEFNLNCEVDNDVNCALLGEMHKEPSKQNIVMLTVGTGIGGAMMINGKIYRGSTNVAGELGYMNLKEGNFEKIASTSALIKRANEVLKIDNLDGRKLVQLYHENNECAIKEIDTQAKYLASGIANLAYILNPNKIILGGGIMENEDIFKKLISKHLKELLIESLYEVTKIEFAKLGNEAGLYGAFSLVNK